MSSIDTLKQLFQLLYEKKLWWMVPMVTVFMVLGLLLVFAGSGSAFSPFIYALF
jgi:hypothetical protein